MSKYSIDGNFIGLFGPLPFRNPHGIAVNDTGTVYVCDTGNKCVQRFEKFWQKIPLTFIILHLENS